MNSNQQVKVKVLRTDEEEHKYIVELNERIYQVNQFAFQRKLPQPQFLDCIASVTPRGGIYVQQDTELLMNQHHQIGDTVNFKIKFTLGDYYQLEDDYGFTAMLSRDTIINAALTPMLRCRITDIRPKYMEVKLVEALGADKSEFSLSAEEFSHIIGPEPWNSERFRQLMLGDTSSALFDLECHRWIAEASKGKPKEDLQIFLTSIRQHCLATLQGDQLLPKCKEAERTLLEQRFTDAIDQLGYYIQAIDIVKEGKAHETIEQILKVLADSAYIYHPRKQFYIMQCIFLLDFSVMETFIPQILATLRSQEQSLWMRSPFQQQWIKLLQLYVENIYPQTDRLATDAKTKETMLQVLVMELMLGKHSANMFFDNGLNQAILYRLVSLMNVSDPNKTLQKAFMALLSERTFDATLPFDGDDAFIMANMLCMQDTNDVAEAFEPIKYETDTVLLGITEQAITIQPKELNVENLYQPFSSRMGLWHGLSIRLDEKPPTQLRGKVGTTIEHYKKLWEYINHSLFTNKRTTAKRHARKLDIDDETDIIITRQLPGQLMFECQIVEEGCEGMGTINALEDIVPFYPGEINVRAFEYSGQPLILHAYVKDVTPEGKYVFAMQENIMDYEDEVRVNDLFYNSRLTCVLNAPAPGATRVPAISSEGYSVSVGPAPGMSVTDLHKGMVVEVDNIGAGTNGYLNGTFLREAAESRFSASEAFHQLMLGYANNETYNPANEKDEIAEARSIDPIHLYELMNIIDAKATLEDDNVKAYNYLNFCRIFAILLGNEERTAYYDNRLQLLEILNDFALFDKINTQKIQKIAESDSELFDKNATLRHDYQQLCIIGCIDSDEKYEELYQWSLNNEDPQLGELASLVLSHNYVKKAGLLTQAGDILDKIRAILKLHKSNSGKKSYGKEDFHTEFKTSIIYPENSMRINVEAQTIKIMQELCAFLNAEGGTLYIGVSDIGYEMGIEEDLKNSLFKGSRDKYEVYVNNKIAYYLGQEANHYIHTHFDPDVSKAVLIIDIKPCPTPISVGNEYFERMGTSARKVNDNYRDKFLALRKQWASEHAPVTDTSAPAPTISKEDGVEQEAQQVKTAEKGSKVETASITDAIQTSRLRNNALHEYEAGWQPIVAVICLIGDDEYKILDDDDWQDYRLKLAVHEDEEEGWLILVYESGHVCKVAMRELLQRERGRVFKRYADEPLIYASIATDDDCVCVGFTDGKHNRYVRFDDVEQYERNTMRAAGTISMDVPNEGVHYVEVVPQKKVADINILRNISRKTLGSMLKTKDGQKCMSILPDCKMK